MVLLWLWDVSGGFREKKFSGWFLTHFGMAHLPDNFFPCESSTEDCCVVLFDCIVSFIMKPLILDILLNTAKRFFTFVRSRSPFSIGSNVGRLKFKSQFSPKIPHPGFFLFSDYFLKYLNLRTIYMLNLISFLMYKVVNITNSSGGRDTGSIVIRRIVNKLCDR